MNDTKNWNEERRKLIRQTICPKGIPDEEFLLFMEQCQRSGLDPLIKQAFCVKRRMNLGTKERPNWVDRYEFQPAEAGMLARAEQFPGFEGITAAEVYAEDPITIDYGTGTVEHRVNPAQRKGALVGAWARVQRAGKVPLVVWVDFAAVNQPTPLWGKMPAVMCRKCARVAALRTAYPEAFGGMYVAGERPDDVDTGEEAETSAPATLEKPALPSPRPVEVLEFTKAPEKVPVRREPPEEAQVERTWTTSDDAHENTVREPGSDDDEGDATENEALAIVHACETVSAPKDFAVLVTRGKKIPEGTPARVRVAAALRRAHDRMTMQKPPEAA